MIPTGAYVRPVCTDTYRRGEWSNRGIVAALARWRKPLATDDPGTFVRYTCLVRGRDPSGQFDGYLSGCRPQTTCRLQLADGGSRQLAWGRLTVVGGARSGRYSCRTGAL